MNCCKPTKPPVDAESWGAFRKSRSSRHKALSLSLLALSTVLLAATAHGHVQLDEPNGGEKLVQGDLFQIRWHVVVEHELENWDLWYSTSGPDGPWIAIATDLPPGDGTDGAIHTHLWTVPGLDSGQVRLRVRQDNLGTDYFDVSDDDVTVVPAGVVFIDGFESGDTDAWNDAVP